MSARRKGGGRVGWVDCPSGSTERGLEWVSGACALAYWKQICSPRIGESMPPRFSLLRAFCQYGRVLTGTHCKKELGQIPRREAGAGEAGLHYRTHHLCQGRKPIYMQDL